MGHVSLEFILSERNSRGRFGRASHRLRREPIFKLVAVFGVCVPVPRSRNIIVLLLSDQNEVFGLCGLDSLWHSVDFWRSICFTVPVRFSMGIGHLEPPS